MAQIKYLEENTAHLYNDGDQVETDILQYAKEHEGNDYWDILNKDSRWPVFYHLTDMRENILNWYDFKPEAEVLEIGAGMGALTGLLCEKAKSVVSVELTSRRAEVIYNRHSKYDNLTILVGNFNKMEFNQKFDYITLIGVLEYAPGFTQDGEPATFIRKIKKLLKPGGKLLIAIENRFGLKYWCGAGEDHTGKPFDGINGYPEINNIRTFSRAELVDLLNECGLQKQKFYYPLPDYKLPQVIYSDEYLPKDKISSKIRQYYLGEPLLLADEGKLYKDIAQNDVFPFMANSFFIECSDTEASEKHPIFALFTPDRKKQYRITTIIYSDDTVRKYAAFPEGTAHLQRVYNQQELYKGDNLVPYEMGDGYLQMPIIHADGTLEDLLCSCIRNGEIEKAKQWMDRFYEMILHSSDLISAEEGQALKHGFIDLTFENCFTKGEQFLVFDQEWMEDNLSPEFIMFHAIRVLYWQNPDLEDYISFNSMVLFYIESMKKIPDYNQKNIDILLEVYSGDSNSLYFLDANKGKMERDLLMKYQKNQKEKETICTFYYDCGNGYSEENSFKIRIDTSLPTVHITEDVPVPRGCRNIRIDPCEGLQCVVFDANFIFSGEVLAYQATNGFLLNGLAVFPTEDPQMLVQFPHDNGLVLRVDMTVRFYSPRDMLFRNIQIAIGDKEKEAQEQIQEIRKTYVHKLIEKADEFDAEIRALKTEAETKNRIEQEYDRISHSFFWKITKPPRAVLDALKKGLRKIKWLNLAILGLKWRIKFGKEEAKRLREEYINWNYR